MCTIYRTTAAPQIVFLCANSATSDRQFRYSNNPRRCSTATQSIHTNAITNMVDSNILVLYHPLYVSTKDKILTGQQYGSAAVHTVVKNRGVQQRGRWYFQAPVGDRYFRNNKKVHLLQDKKRLPCTERPTHKPRTSKCTLYQPTDQIFTTYSAVQLRSSTYSSTPGTRGAAGWLVFEDLAWNRKQTGEVSFYDDTRPSRGASEPPFTTHTPLHPFTHGPIQCSSTAMQQYVEQYT